MGGYHLGTCLFSGIPDVLVYLPTTVPPLFILHSLPVRLRSTATAF